jgi:hypothetical protein
MTTAKWTLIQERSKMYAILLQDLMKRIVSRCRGRDALMAAQTTHVSCSFNRKLHV